MTPSAEPNALAAGLAAKAELLQEGEEILLAVKPSAWFILLVSLPVLLLAASPAVIAYLAARYLQSNIPYQTIALLCLAVACGRIMLACFQWMGRLYVLTNLRIMRIQGVLREEVFDCLLKRIADASVSASLPQRVVHVGSLRFHLPQAATADEHWTCLSHVEKVRRAVLDAIRHAR